MAQEHLDNDKLCLILDDSSRYCHTTPRKSIVNMPTGCRTRDGETTYDRGRCLRGACRQHITNDTSTCRDKHIFCCGGVKFATIMFVCDEGSHNARAVRLLLYDTCV